MNMLSAAVRGTCIGLVTPLLLLASPRVPQHSPKPIGSSPPAILEGTETTPTELAQLWSLLDRDGDGSVAAFEGAEALLWLTGEMDAKTEGVQLDELRAFLANERRSERDERRELFATLDVDANATLDPAEVPAELALLFDTADHDGDGRLSEGEVLSARDLGDPARALAFELRTFLEEADHDQDGAFALSDLPASEQHSFAADFRALDVDGDDLVTEEELFALLEEELRQATFIVEGPRALMDGVIGPSTPGRVLELLLEHPEVDTIVMRNVPGSIDDASNLRAARYVRRHGLGTLLPADGEIASGGTDCFLGGVQRKALPGARIGIHSWSGYDEEGADLPRDHPEHAKYLEFYREMGIPAAFYWRTLDAAPADDIHWMTRDEIERFGIETD